MFVVPLKPNFFHFFKIFYEINFICNNRYMKFQTQNVI